MFNYEQNLIFWQLLLYGIHIGHRFQNSSLYSGWFVFTYTHKTLIINLYKTILGFKNGYVGHDYCCKVGSPIWFLNLNRAYDIYTNESALKCGEFAYSTYWIHGMISNWLHISDQINQLWHYTEDAHKGQFKKLEMDYSPWFLSRWSWPRSLLISSVHTSEWPSHECLVSRTPSVGICDTNISGHISNIATPGNDDSLDSIVYYNTSTSQYILEKKYGYIIAWLNRIREYKRNISFSEWILRYYLVDNRLNKKKLITNIMRRENKNKISDYMKYFIKFKINIMNYWGLGIKFFFSLGSGENKFQGSLDLYEPNDIEEDRWGIYSLLEKFKKRGFFICKILNYYLMGSTWHTSSSSIVRKKFMSQKWFKFRFLTCAYYKEEWHDDYYRTNFLKNRFWRNRIFKTYFRKSKFRRSKFALKFFKFFNIYRYNKKRGFMDNFSATYLNNSSFSNIAFSHGFNYFKKHFYNSLINNNNNINFLKINKKHGYIAKWLFFKREIQLHLNEIINSEDVSKLIKFTSLYRVYFNLKNKLKEFVYVIYSYLNFYYSFWYINRLEYKFIKRTKKTQLIRKFRSLKHITKFFKHYDCFNRSMHPFKRFQTWFLNKKIRISSMDLFNYRFAKIYSAISLKFRRKYFNLFLGLRSKKVRAFKKYFRKIKTKNSYANYINNTIDTLDFKYDRFKKTKEVRDIVEKLHRRVRLNYAIQFYNEKYNINIHRKSNFIQTYNIVKKYNKPAMRLLSFNSLKYNFKNFNFYQISKNIYNKKYLDEWSTAVTMKNEDWGFIKDKEDLELPSLFLKVFSKSNRPTYDWISLHNLKYFNKVILDTTFEKINRKIRFYVRKYKILRGISKKKLYNFLEKNFYLKKKIYKYSSIMRALRKKYKAHVRRAGIKQINFIAGIHSFSNFNYLRFWSIIKRNFFLNKGFTFNIWEVNFNKTIDKKYKNVSRFTYKYNNEIVKNYTYFFMIRFQNIYNNYLNIFSKKLLNYNKDNFIIPKKKKNLIYSKEIRKIYWN